MPENPDSELVAVFTAPDETTANIVVGLLESEGIQTDMETSGTTWGGRAAVVDMLDQLQNQQWGYVVVARKDEERSRELIQAYEPHNEQISKKPDWSARYSAVSLRVACVTCGLYAVIGLCVALSDDYIAHIVFTCTIGIALLIYGLIMMSWQKRVPTQFYKANKQIANGLLIIAAISSGFFVGYMGFFQIPKSIVLLVYSLILAASIYGTIRRYPALLQESEGRNE